MLGGEGSKPNHILDNMHTHIGIGVYVVDNRLRYIEASDVGLISSQLETWVVHTVLCTRMQLLPPPGCFFIPTRRSNA